MVLPVFREAVIAGGSASASSVTATLAQAAASGELLVAFAQWQDAPGTSVATPDAGWVLLGAVAQGLTDRVACYWRYARGAVAGLTLSFSLAVARPYVALVAHTASGGGMGIRPLDVQPETNQNSATGRYGAAHLEPQDADGLALFFFAFQFGVTQTYAAAPTGLTLRGSSAGLYLFDGGGLGGQHLDPQVTVAQTGFKKWESVGVEIRALPPGQRPAGGTFVPDRVYEDLSRRVWTKGLGVPGVRS